MKFIPERPGIDEPRGFAAKERQFLTRFGFDPDSTYDEIAEKYVALPTARRNEIEGAWYELMREVAADEWRQRVGRRG